MERTVLQMHNNSSHEYNNATEAAKECGGAQALQAAIQAGDVTVKINKEGKKRYWIHDEVEDDLETITGTQKLHGKMELSKQQWGFSFR